ncbi:hypothetical protein ACFYNX_31285 [Streptomyces sp. NPDC007872]|uniref:hypothetical protein n=1 Tax=Streptomyces sp. NPDC007872 TaxID=3364782 RepID=UPI003691F39B
MGGWSDERGDERLLRGRVYSHDLDPGPKPGRNHAGLVGGPPDGLLLDIHGRRAGEVDDGVALIAELGRWPGGRTLYDPCPGKLTRAGISFLLVRF